MRVNYSIEISMNYNINKNEEKISICKSNYYCSNCNYKGHTYKFCKKPIISNGVIAFYIPNFNMNKIKKLEEMLSEEIDKEVIEIENKEIEEIEEDYNKEIKFVLIQRKHSLGYLEFIRGRYNPNSKTSIDKLVKQMVPSEIEYIIESDFDTLWNNLWDNKNKRHNEEYIRSKENFYKLELNNYKFDVNKSIYQYNEWGMPKGRREVYESDMMCGLREFEEETLINENQYILLEGCEAITEYLTGTNNIKYQHNYYLCILKSNIISENFINKEIADIQLLDIKECIEIIRPYHIEKKEILIKIYKTIKNFMLKENK